jgi:hypothetical protein
MAKTLEQRVVDLEEWAAKLSLWFLVQPNNTEGAAWPWLKDHEARITDVEKQHPKPHLGNVPPPPPPPPYPPKPL